jgi:hypothetical protein
LALKTKKFVTQGIIGYLGILALMSGRVQQKYGNLNCMKRRIGIAFCCVNIANL